MMEQWQASAKNLIYHYRCRMGAMRPFSMEWTKEMIQEAKLDSEALRYIGDMSRIVENYGEVIQTYPKPAVQITNEVMKDVA